MADQQKTQANRQRPRPTSHLQTHSYKQYHDPESDLFWPEPVEKPSVAAVKIGPVSQPAAPEQTKRKDVIKRRPVAPIVSKPPPPSVKPLTESALLSPVLPSPLRIRKPGNPSPQPAQMRTVRLLIASLGNPPPYHSTRHSAGHIMLKNLTSQLGLPMLNKSKLLGSGHVSAGSDVGRSEYTLWQSASMMNISGAGTFKAWKTFTAMNAASDNVVTALVILHDELESASGTIKLRRGESSPKGHNGIKDVQLKLKSAGLLAAMGDRFIKIGIGIGRPLSREKDDVSAWVLGQLTAVEKQKLEAATETLATVLASEVSKLQRS